MSPLSGLKTESIYLCLSLREVSNMLKHFLSQSSCWAPIGILVMVKWISVWNWSILLQYKRSPVLLLGWIYVIVSYQVSAYIQKAFHYLFTIIHGDLHGFLVCLKGSSRGFELYLALDKDFREVLLLIEIKTFISHCWLLCPIRISYLFLFSIVHIFSYVTLLYSVYDMIYI